MKKRFFAIMLAISVLTLCSACKIDKTVDIKKKSEASEVEELSIFSYKPDTFCPIASNNEANVRMLGIVYDGLVELTDELVPLPSLADSWSASVDGLYWIINLKKDIKWHGGDEVLSAKDVVYTINQIKNMEKSAYKYNVSNIESVNAETDLSVKISLIRPNANFINLLYFPIIKNSDEEIDFVNYKPVGTGPYMFEDRNEGNIYYLVKNPTWWGGNAKADVIKVKMLPNVDTALYAFGSGSLDLVPADNMDWGKFVDPAASSYTKVKTPIYNFLGINHKNPQLAMYELRRAISLAIDRDELIDEARMGYAVAANAPARPEWFVCENQMFGHHKDTAAAKKLLEENGWKFTDNVYRKSVDGVNYSAAFSILINEENTVRENIARILAKSLEEFGIRANVVRVSYEEYTKRITEGNYDTFIGSTIIAPDLDYLTFMGEGNIYSFDDEETRFVMNEIGKKKSTEDIKSGYAELINLFEQLNPIVGLFFEDSVMVYTKQIDEEVKPSYFDIYSGIENIKKGEAKH